MKQFSWMLIGLALIITGCQNTSNTVWEDTKTMGRYLHRKGQLLLKQDIDSRLVESEEEFTGPEDEEYIPLKDKDLKTQFADLSIPQPKDIPGAIGSPIPNINHFTKPIAEYANLFKTIYFNTNEHILRDKNSLHIVAQIAKYMKKNSNLYISVEGHCDERASEAYNLALGTRRAESIRKALVKHNVNPNHIFPISYGKELPAALGSSPEIWAKNRRVEFKIYEK